MTIWIVEIEPVESRYTAQWKKYIPDMVRRATNQEVIEIEGPTDIPAATTPGAFLNFGGTNVYKSNQMEQMSRHFTEGRVKKGDHIVFTDAWNPGILQIRYMSDLLGISVKIHALWHAGSYDPQDFLGRLITNKEWTYNTERALFYAIDHNHFATDFHIKMFADEILPTVDAITLDNWQGNKIIRTGWPMEYMRDVLTPYMGMKKENIVLFPHRIAPEKQVDIFRDLGKYINGWEFIVCQDEQLTKDEYHELLGKAKMVFSANLQETLGISCYEGALTGAIPLVPNRLSYVEMYSDRFKYPSEWTTSFNSYMKNRDVLSVHIVNMLNNYDSLVEETNNEANLLEINFFNCNNFLDTLK